MNRIYTYTDECPHLEKQHSITVDYDSVDFCGDSQTYYVKGNFRCSLTPKCTYRDEDNECPIYLKAPKSI